MKNNNNTFFCFHRLLGLNFWNSILGQAIVSIQKDTPSHFMMVRFGEAGKEFENTYMVALYFPCIFFREGVFVVAMVPVLYVGTSLTHFTARKRSLRRLCFHRCLSVHGGVFGLCPGGSPLGGSPSRGVSVQGASALGISVQGRLGPGGSLSGRCQIR